jgi:hypothetical protein
MVERSILILEDIAVVVSSMPPTSSSTSSTTVVVVVVIATWRPTAATWTAPVVLVIILFVWVILSVDAKELGLLAPTVSVLLEEFKHVVQVHVSRSRCELVVLHPKGREQALVHRNRGAAVLHQVALAVVIDR